MPQFAPDQVTFGDYAGLGAWDDNHHREHQQFVTVLAGRTPDVLIPNFDLLQMLTAGQARGSIAQSHQKAHELLGAALGITQTDFSGFNLDDENDFYSFLGYHSESHRQIRAALGIV